MWGVHPSKLTADWAPKRLELREDNNKGLFEDQWQGLPLEGYSKFIENILAGIPVKLRTTGFNAHEFDVVAYSGPIDRILSYKYGELRYRSLMFSYKNDEPWDKEEYGTINLPQHPEFIRKCNFKVLHKQVSKHNYIQYQEPIEANGTNVPMYPIHTPSDNERFFIYLKELCSQGNVCPIGRLGLYKYLDMDKAVEVAFDMVDIIENYLLLNGEERIRRISEVCDSR
jgi:UDP-galactopyranose mutase